MISFGSAGVARLSVGILISAKPLKPFGNTSPSVGSVWGLHFGLMHNIPVNNRTGLLFS